MVYLSDVFSPNDSLYRQHKYNIGFKTQNRKISNSTIQGSAEKLTIKTAVPHPLGDIVSQRHVFSYCHGFVQSLSIEHQTIIESPRDYIHLYERDRERLMTNFLERPMTNFTSMYLFFLCKQTYCTCTIRHSHTVFMREMNRPTQHQATILMKIF